MQTGGAALQEMQFEYSLVDYGLVEAAIAQNLGISSETVRSLIRYRID